MKNHLFISLIIAVGMTAISCQKEEITPKELANTPAFSDEATLDPPTDRVQIKYKDAATGAELGEDTGSLEYLESVDFELASEKFKANLPPCTSGKCNSTIQKYAYKLQQVADQTCRVQTVTLTCCRAGQEIEVSIKASPLSRHCVPDNTRGLEK